MARPDGAILTPKGPDTGYGVALGRFRIVVTATADHYLLADRFGHHLGTVWAHKQKPARGRLLRS
ncbi:hypothetical protein THIOKS1900004 [Thiocapsa sp. KS1]|nr:hypothetical protein THIOKS1900004 [Thiocapsa sp. KS1]